MGTDSSKSLAISVCTKCDRRGLINRKTGTCTGSRIKHLKTQDTELRSVRCEVIAERKAARS